MSDRSEADRASDDLVERVARALSEDRGYDWDKHVNFRPAFRRMARAAIAVLRPALRAEALEEAANYCEMKAKHYWGDGRDCCDAALQQTAAAIRAITPQEDK